jgi:hypothetical protein
MTDPHDREPVDQATIDCWRANYGLDKRTPAEAAKWWSDNMRGLAPSGCVAALGVALDELEALRALAAPSVPADIAAKLHDPVLVHAAMLRGEIATPAIRDMLHVYGADALARWDAAPSVPSGEQR